MSEAGALHVELIIHQVQNLENLKGIREELQLLWAQMLLVRQQSRDNPVRQQSRDNMNKQQYCLTGYSIFPSIKSNMFNASLPPSKSHTK